MCADGWLILRRTRPPLSQKSIVFLFSSQQEQAPNVTLTMCLTNPRVTMADIFIQWIISMMVLLLGFFSAD